LKLGDTREQALQSFPFKPNMDQEFKCPGCGTEYLWVDTENPHKGNLFIRFEAGKVFQIDVATTRYHTVRGLKVHTSPETVRRNYMGLRSYALLGRFSEATGGVPMIFWVDHGRGIAFGFAAERLSGRRYLYEIIVFAPGSKFCPAGEGTDSPDWRELAPYSLEPPDEKPPAPGGNDPD
jgi:hypothetical protein